MAFGSVDVAHKDGVDVVTSKAVGVALTVMLFVAEPVQPEDVTATLMV